MGGQSTPKPRRWVVEEHPVDDPETGERLGWVLSEDEATRAYEAAQTIQEYLGGAILIIPERIQNEDGTFRTRKLIFEWTFAPAAPAPEPEAAEPVEEPEPVAA